MIAWIKLGVSLAFEALDEIRREQRKRKEAEQWAKTLPSIRACPKCREIAYTPGQAACTKCGALLAR